MIIESLLSFIAGSLVLASLLSFTYYALAREYVRFVGQEALFCMLEIDQPRRCEHEAQDRLSKALQYDGDSWVQLSGQGRKRKIARLSFRPYKKPESKEYLQQSLSLSGVRRAGQ